MLKSLSMGAAGVGAAVLFGYGGAAAMQTELGQAILAALAAAIGVAVVMESVRTFGPSASRSDPR
jgi:hypothetical protein